MSDTDSESGRLSDVSEDSGDEFVSSSEYVSDDASCSSYRSSPATSNDGLILRSASSSPGSLEKYYMSQDGTPPPPCPCCSSHLWLDDDWMYDMKSDSSSLSEADLDSMDDADSEDSHDCYDLNCYSVCRPICDPKTGRTTPLSLSKLCQSYILMHWEKFPIGYLSLLPLSERVKFLYKLPIADVCILEDTEFTKGIDMEAFWTYMCGEEIEKLKSAIKGWNTSKFAREVHYGQIARYFIGSDDRRFSFPVTTYNGEEFVKQYATAYDTQGAVKYLYAIRDVTYKPNKGFWSFCSIDDYFIPCRFQQKASLRKFHKKDLIAAAKSCFRGDLPKVLTEVLVEDVDLKHAYFLSDLRFVHVVRVVRTSDTSSILTGTTCHKFIDTLLKIATKLEVLNLYGDDMKEMSRKAKVSLDKLCTILTSYPNFWSTFCQLNILSCPRYTVSQKKINELIVMYLSAPTEHNQKLRLTSTTIEKEDSCNHSLASPKFDQKYLHLKTIELVDCQFMECEADAESVSDWLGQGIDILASEEENACLFRVKSVSVQTPDRGEKDSDVQ